MANFNLPNVYDGMSTEELIVVVGKMKKMLDWILYNVDSKNVTQLNTNITRIKSQNGETYINGPLLMMNDGVIDRLILGYDETDDKFKFILYDGLGNESIYMNDFGEAVFSGNIATLKDAYVGNDLYLGDMLSDESKTLYFHGGDVYTESYISSVVFSGYSSLFIKTSNMFVDALANINIDANDILVDAAKINFGYNTIVDFGRADVINLENSGYATIYDVDDAMDYAEWLIEQHLIDYH